MAVSEEFLQYVRDQLRGVGEVDTRRMFGGAGIYLGERFFALVDNDELFFKVSAATRPHYESAGSHAFEPWEGHVMNGYWSVPAEVLDSATELAQWAQGALSAATTKPGKKKRNA
ncbi:MAG: TfoX/Sxy family protein [Planctomycetes bacterium]|nr:TfoX/Sxy family protein [Planctomycetota bacterium]MCW8136267.1 TfoX/Sxy family protein [Planctomycetota bacterium]